MELKELIKLFSRNFRVSLLVSGAIGVLAFFTASFLPPWYKASATLFVTRSVDKSSSYFAYEGFYSIQTAEKFTDTLVGLLKSADVKRLALESSGIKFDPESLGRLEKAVFIKKASPQLVTVSVTDKSESYARRLLLELSKEVVKESVSINKEGDANILVAFVSGGGGEESALVVEKRVNSYVLGLGFFALSFFSVVFLLSLKSYMKG
ncbi:MAG: Wzz/FepE/Etk N-terminal domain-containing protein [Patescibacteria group bacterium]